MKRIILVLVVWGALHPVALLQAQPYFQNYFHFPGYSAETNAVVQLPNGQIAVGGILHNDQTEEQSAVLLLLGSAGNVIWVRQFDVAGEKDVLSDIQPTSDGQMLLAFGQTTAGGSISGVAKMDLSGNLLWSIKAPNYNYALKKITPASDGFLLTGDFWPDFSGLVIKIDPDGLPLWGRIIKATDGAPISLFTASEDSQGNFYVVGMYNHEDGVLLRMSKTGSLDWARRLGTSISESLEHIVSLSGDRLLLGGNSGGTAGFARPWLVQTDWSGAVKWARAYSDAGGDLGSTDLLGLGSGAVFCVSAPDLAANEGTRLARINDSGDLLWLKDYDPAGNYGIHAQVCAAANNELIVASALQTGGGVGFYVVRANAGGDAPPCCFRSGNLNNIADISVENQVFSPNVSPAQPLVQWFPSAASLDVITTNYCNPASTGFSLSDSLICPGDCIELTITDTTPWATYKWTYPGGVPDGDKPGTVCFPAFTADTAIILTANNCPYQQSRVTLKLDSGESQFPNAFTPNNDGVNDEFKLLLHCPSPKYLLSIYNRWGELVFESRDPDVGWDGINLNGFDAPADIYAWVLEIENPDGLYRNKGSVALLR